MEYKDSVYGDVIITDKLALDLIESQYFQRLKGINMAGYFEPFFPGSAHSRFEHSIGVYVLLKMYGASIEEQVSGLLHDISHGAFSHCLDYVFDEGSEKNHDHQDNIFEQFIKNTDIPEILERHKIDVDFILNDKNFPLKETLLPDLCADRIDYILRGAAHYDNKNLGEIRDILSHLKVYKNIRVFDNIVYAKKFAELFKRVNDLYYASISTAIMFRTTGDFLKHALHQNYITKEDLYTTDQEVLDKIVPHLLEDKELMIHRDRMNNKTTIQNNPDDFDVQVFCKDRVVDPFFKEGDEVVRLSERSGEWKNIVENTQPKEYFLKFEK